MKSGMPGVFALFALSVVGLIGWRVSLGSSALDPIQVMAEKIVAETANGPAYDDLAELVGLGSRLTGSAGAEKAVKWALAKLNSYGFDEVREQRLKVPHWIRGSKAQASLPGRRRGDEPQQLAIAALGGSVGTPLGGISAPVVEVHNLKEVAELGDRVKGKIVFYNRPMDASLEDTFEAYSKAVDQRSSGAAQAARHGALAAIVRSMTTLTDDELPHTGVMRYPPGSTKVPGVAISTRDAAILSARIQADPSVPLSLELDAHQADEVESGNVIAEIRGREKPDEVVLIGGHLDSWDLGPGAQDDGAGVIHSVEALRALKKLGLRPRRTVRVVLFMAEEFGGFGGEEYARQAGKGHIAAIESDRGGFEPVGFTLAHENADAGLLERLQGWGKYLRPAHADRITWGYSGTDVEPLAANGAVTLGFVPVSTHYFDYHHSARDTLKAVDPAELKKGAASLAILAYLLAEEGITRER